MRISAIGAMAIAMVAAVILAVEFVKICLSFVCENHLQQMMETLMSVHWAGTIQCHL